MLFHFAFLVLALALNAKNIWREINEVNKKTWIILFLIFLAGFYFRNCEYWMGTFSDGYVYAESAKIWILTGDFVKSCGLGNIGHCLYFEQALFFTGYPFLIALVDLLFGISSLHAAVISGVLSSLTILLIFLVAYFIFKKEEIGLYSALVYAFLPLNIIFSQTGLSRPSGLFFLSVSLFFYLLAVKNNRLISWLAVAAFFSYAVYIRPESYVLLPVLVLFFFVFKFNEVRKFFKSINWQILIRVLFVVAIFIALQVPNLNWLLNGNPANNQPTGGFYSMQWRDFFNQGSANFLLFFNFFTDLYFYNYIISIIFFISIIWLIFLKKKEYYFLVCLFLAYFLVYGFIFDGRLQGHGQLTFDFIRRSLMFDLFYCVIAGFGLSLLIPVKLRLKKYSVFAVMAVLVILSSGIFLKIYSDKYGYIMSNYFPMAIFRDSRADKPNIYSNKFYQAIAKTPGDCLVLTSHYLVATSDYFFDNQRKGASLDLIFPENKELFIGAINSERCAIYIEDEQCNLESNKQKYYCDFVKNNLEKKYLFSEENLNIYEIKIKANSI